MQKRIVNLPVEETKQMTKKRERTKNRNKTSKSCKIINAIKDKRIMLKMTETWLEVVKKRFKVYNTKQGSLNSFE